MKSSLEIQYILSELKTVEEHVGKIQDKWGISQKDAIHINLILDELVTNIIEHGGSSTEKKIKISFTRMNEKLTIEVADTGPPFDPTRCTEVDTTLPLEKRQCGGLGIHIVRKLCSCSSYTRLKGKNIFTLNKTL
ncbi:MAG: ATP-binding protein [Desulfobulbaceae bacterium]|nr:ATP-binding protein [Desulfobulbaceae bacterium]